MVTAAESLTPRQLEVLELVAKGLTNREIGNVLGIAAATVKRHVEAVIGALDVTNRTEAAMALQELSAPAVSEDQRVPGFGGRPAIAVLPFENRSERPEHAFLADAIVEDLTTQLGCWRWFPVIARHSAAAFRGQPIGDVGRALGARYVVEGSARAQGDRVRIHVAMNDVETGAQVYANRFDRRLSDVFAVQDEIVESIVGALEPLLLQLEGLRAARKPAHSLGAWDQAQRGIALLMSQSMQDAHAACAHFDEAIAIEPEFALGHAGRAAAQLFLGIDTVRLNAGGEDSKTQQERMQEAFTYFFAALESGQKATSLDAHDAHGFVGLGGALFMTGQRDAAMTAYDRALDLNPNSALVCFMAGQAFGWGPRWEESGALYERALRLSPRDPALHHFEASLAGVRIRQGRLDEAHDLARLSCDHEPEGAFSHRPLLITALVLGNRMEEAERECERMRAAAPDWSASMARLVGPPELIEPVIECLGRAGWDLSD